MKHFTATIFALILFLAMIGTGDKYQAFDKKLDQTAISFVGIDPDGRVYIRGTLVFYVDGDEIECAHNIVLDDSRGDLLAATDNVYGFTRIGKVDAKRNETSNCLIRIKPNLLDLESSYYELDLNLTNNMSGAWKIVAGGVGVTQTGTCQIWNCTITDRIRPHLNSADDLIAYWNTSRDQLEDYQP